MALTAPSLSGSRGIELAVYRHVLLAIGLSVICALIVLAAGWISDDGLITMRYADNLLHGHGPVFNVDERVQGFTHPIWFLLVAAGLAIKEDPVYIAVALGSFLTFGLALTTLIALRNRTSRWLELGLLLMTVFLASEAWRSFQTGGLENPLSHLLIAMLVIETSRKRDPRPFVIALLSSLLALTRLDLAVLVAPLAFIQAYQAYREHNVLALALGWLPLLIWGAFAYFYYGDLLPNTANAKVGIYSTEEAIRQGIRYIQDFAHYEPFSVLSTCILFACGLLGARTAHQRAFALGILLYFGYVVCIGGDFMRGRFLLPVFVASCFIGGFALPSLFAGRKVSTPLCGGLVALSVAFLFFQSLVIDRDSRISSSGIVNERIYYRGYSLAEYLHNGRLTGRGELAVVDDVRRFTDKCGPFTIHAKALGAPSYAFGAQVSVIDLIGLTDRYVASLPRSSLSARPRPGHPHRKVPISYLSKRRDIAMFSNWQDAVRAGDCGIIAATASYEESDRTYYAGEPESALPLYIRDDKAPDRLNN